MKRLMLLLVVLLIGVNASLAQNASAAPGQPYVIEYYYKTKWGHADEFLKLFKKNHYPLLNKEVEMGRMVKVWMDQPRYHTTEDGRWDYRVTIVFKNSTVANEPFEEDALKKQLWPDQAAYEREEQRRFEILDAHWDLPVKTLDLEKERAVADDSSARGQVKSSGRVARDHTNPRCYHSRCFRRRSLLARLQMPTQYENISSSPYIPNGVYEEAA
jgi:hypothetical protein